MVHDGLGVSAKVAIDGVLLDDLAALGLEAPNFTNHCEERFQQINMLYEHE